MEWEKIACFRTDQVPPHWPIGKGDQELEKRLDQKEVT
jgi:hypothetical protein